MSQRKGARILLVVTTITLGLGLAASAYLNYYQYQRASVDKQMLQDQITDLRYQVSQDAKAASSSPSTTPGPHGATPSPSPSPVVQGIQSMNMTQLGAKLTVSDPVADLTYAHEKVGTLEVANLTTSSLLAKYAACTPGALGMIVRRPPGSRPTSASSRLIKSLSGFSYYYVPPTGNCGPTAAAREAITNQRNALVNVILPTLSN